MIAYEFKSISALNAFLADKTAEEIFSIITNGYFYTVVLNPPA